MKSPLRRRISPSVPFTLTFEDENGTSTSSYKLAYNWNSLALVEEQLGKSILLDIGEILENPSIRNVSVLLWAALQENHEEDFEGIAGLKLVRQNLTVGESRKTLDACSEAYVKQLSQEQQNMLKEIQAARAAGTDAPPLSESPVAQG